MLDTLRNNFLNHLDNTSLVYKRYMHTHLDMNEKLIGILGSRGVGKTTFILQYLKELNIPLEKKLYITADHFYVNRYSL